MKKYIIPTILSLFLIGSFGYAATKVFPYQGGTGQDTSGWTGVIRVDSGTYSTTSFSGAETDPVFLAASSTLPTLSWIGTIGTGTWQGTPIEDDYITSSSTWNAKWDALSDMTLAGGQIYVGNHLDNPIATSTIFISSTTGNVGISTTSPEYALDVEGTFGVSGASIFTGGVIFESVATGVTPVVSAHLATKGFVEDSIHAELDLFLASSTDGGTGFYEMFDFDLDGTEQSFASNTAANTDDQLIATWISSITIPTSLEIGVYTLHVHAEETGSNNNTQIYFTLATTSGAVAMASEVSDTITTKTSLVIHSALASDIELLSTDKLLLRIYANVGSGPSGQITIYYEGRTSSRLEIPAPTSIFSDIFLRQDGTKALTSQWDVGAQNIVNIGDVTIGTTTNSGLLTVGTATPIMVVLDDGNVGIKTASPLAPLHIKGDSILNRGLLTLQEMSGGGSPHITLYNDTSHMGNIGFISGNFYVQNIDDSDMFFFTNNTNRLTIKNTGLVGIATSSPAFGLESLASTSLGYFGVTDGRGAESGGLFIIDENGYVGIGTTSPSTALTVSGTTTVQGNISLSQGGDSYLYFDAGTDYLLWDDGGDNFFFSNDLSTNNMMTSGSATTGSLTITGLSNGFAYIDAGGNLSTSTVSISNTDLVAGRSLSTSTAGQIDADAELYTEMLSISIQNATTIQNPAAQHKFATNVTITRVTGSTDNGSTTFQFDIREETTPNTAGWDLMSAVLVADTTTGSTTAFATSTISADQILSLDLDAVLGTVTTSVRIHVDYTKDD